MACDSPHEREMWVEALRGMAGRYHNTCSPIPVVERARTRDAIHAVAKNSVSSVSDIFSKAAPLMRQGRMPDDDEHHECFVSLKCGDEEYSRTLLFSVESEQEGQVFVDVVRRMSREKKAMVEREALEQTSFANRLRVTAFQTYHSLPGQVVSNTFVIMAFLVTMLDSQLRPSDDHPVARTINVLEVVFTVGGV
jgi:hypothetical protein